MALRLYSEFKSLRGEDYRIEIYDSNHAGVSTAFKVGADGFNLQVGEGSERFERVLPSQASFTMLIETSVQESFITALVAAPEKQFVLKILKGSGNALEWVGVIVSDQVRQLNAPKPYPFEVVATDGLGLLKDVDYNNAGSAYTGKATFLQHLFNVLGKSGLQDFWGTDDKYLATVVNWEESQQDTTPASFDALEKTRFDHAVLYSTDGNGITTFKSCFAVLELICQTWGARFYLSGGVYQFRQVNEFDNNSKTIQYYKKGATAHSTATGIDESLDIDFSDMFIQAGSEWNWLPALQKVSLKYNFRESGNMAEGAVFDNNNTANFFIPSLDVPSGSTLRLKGVIEYRSKIAASVYASAPFPDHKYKFRIFFKIGTNWLARTASAASLSNIDYSDVSFENSLSYYEIFSETVTQFQNNHANYLSFNVQTPALPVVNQSALFAFTLEKVIDSETQTIAADANHVFEYRLLSPILEAYDEGQNELITTRKYTATNPNLGNTALINLETIIGDAVTDKTLSRLQVFDGTDWQDSADWTVGGTGTAKTIQELLINEILAGQVKPVAVLSGSILRGNSGAGFVSANSLLTYSGLNYVLLSATFTANYDNWTGSWFALSVNNSGITESNEDIVDTDIIPDLPGLIMSNTVVNNTTPAPSIGLEALQIATTSSSTQGTVTSVAINAAAADILRDGHKIRIINPSTGEFDILDVKSSVSKDATSISVESESLSAKYPAGSLILVEATSAAESTASGNYESFENASGSTLDVSFDLPKKNVNLVLEVLRGGVKCRYKSGGTGVRDFVTGSDGTNWRRITFALALEGEDVEVRTLANF